MVTKPFNKGVSTEAC